MAKGQASGRRNADFAKSEPIDAAAESLYPLDFMLSLLRDPDASTADRKWAAEKAAPYLHPRLQTVEHGGEVTLRHEEALKDLA